jgi:uncharacterized membrane protein
MNGSQTIDYVIPIISQMFIGPLMLAISIVFWKFPPKTINKIYGYRTKKSMLNQENWDFANKEFAKLFMLGNVFTIITQIATTLIYDHLTGIACGIFCLLTMFLVSFLRVESELKKW